MSLCCIKEGVWYNLVNVSDIIRPWLVKVFEHWEPDTFKVFRYCANRDATAIDIGAYIGLTPIWLCQNFKHVVCVEADFKAADSLRCNLLASLCSGYSIIQKAIYSQSNLELLFGPNAFLKSDTLNNSTSQLKQQSCSKEDYLVGTIKLCDLNVDFSNVAFIKVDIEGGEENIIPDLFEICNEHKILLYISFHTTWWQNNGVERFERYFNLAARVYQNGLEPNTGVVEYLKANPFGSLLFEFKTD